MKERDERSYADVLSSNIIVSKNEGHIQIANHSDRKHLNDSKDQDILWLLNSLSGWIIPLTCTIGINSLTRFDHGYSPIVQLIE
ncbi:hypothetical protein NC652_028927 [Populus alba x Populus x berolinensis]|nr:hypothetical protein NC652_028927 [Populus alba x Populus x berolinensis]